MPGIGGIAFDLDDTVMRSANALDADLPGETVILSIADGRYYGLSNTSQYIWQRLATPVRIRALCGELAERYEAPPETIEAGTLEFLEKFRHVGLIVKVGTAADTGRQS
ncbi:PqqD family protein [Aquabacter cavernae]|uniref:PqqD family protein n=1 Tax=Aquabacter cavernae TaxID=2496029 RepID=UPI0013DEFD28|nr:PqqD family protein [Aquabacter cavernae]